MIITKKQDLINNPYDLKNELHLLECFYSEKINRFCLRFNGRLFTYKTYGGFLNKRNYFTKKYDLQ